MEAWSRNCGADRAARLGMRKSTYSLAAGCGEEQQRKPMSDEHLASCLSSQPWKPEYKEIHVTVSLSVPLHKTLRAASVGEEDKKKRGHRLISTGQKQHSWQYRTLVGAGSQGNFT